MAFSFTRGDTEAERAVRDLGVAIDALVADGEIEAALASATERLKQELTDEALQEQQRLREARQNLRERLAQLVGTD